MSFNKKLTLSCGVLISSKDLKTFGLSKKKSKLFDGVAGIEVACSSSVISLRVSVSSSGIAFSPSSFSSGSLISSTIASETSTSSIFTAFGVVSMTSSASMISGVKE